MSAWQPASLGDLVDFSNGLNFSAANEGNGLKIVKVKDFQSRHYVDAASLDEINPSGLKIKEASLLRRGDIVIVRSNGNKDLVGRAMIYSGPPNFVAFAGFCIRGRVRSPEVSARFIHYWLRSPTTREILGREGSGTGIQNVSQQLLKSQRILLPPLPEQRRIASLLGALDDRIELNRAMNGTLEEMARGLFRSWFVDFDPVHARAAGEAPAGLSPETAALFPDSFAEDGLPVGWGMGRLGDIAVAPKRGVKPDAIDPSTPYIGLEHMPRRSIALDAWEAASKVGSQKSMMREGEFLFGKLRPYFHKVGIVPVDGICSTDIVVVAPKAAEWAGFVLSVISSDAFVEHTNASSSGTRMPRTNWRDMAAFEVALPSKREAAAFERICNPMRQRIVANIHESRTLAELRDALLPRLMSGELRVREAEEMAEAPA